MSSAAMTEVAVTGFGAVSAAGVGAPALWDVLASGRSLIAPLRQPWAAGPEAWGAAVGDTGAHARIPARRLRRLGRLSQLAVSAAAEALEGAGLSEREAVGAVVGTGLGALQETVTFLLQVSGPHPEQANPALFPASVMSVAAAQISMELGLRGYNTTVNHKEISAELALLTARDALSLGRAPALLCGGVDELSAATYGGYRRFKALAEGPAQPYAMARQGCNLGEGACFLLLEPASLARQQGRRLLATIAGGAVRGGPRPLTSWGPGPAESRLLGPAREAGEQAVLAALAEAGLGPEDIDLVVGCGCGSRQLDRLEADVLRRVFGRRPVALCSPHGGLGSYMAAGGLRLVAAVLALGEGLLFPTVTAPPVDLGLELAGLVTAPRPAAIRAVLVCSHATGGGSAAIVLTRGER